MNKPKHISLSQLQTLIQRHINDVLPMPIWVVAEVSELKINYASGHCYLGLVENDGDKRVPKAKVSAVIWSTNFKRISDSFTTSTGQELAEGMEVLVRINVSYHALYGLSLVVSDIDPLYTVGAMEMQLQKTIARLKEDGVFDMNRSLGLPIVIQRLAVISSRNAAGYQDFMDELGSSSYHFHTTLFEAFMQGDAAEGSVILAMEQILERLEEFDAVVLIRGGGAQSDLAVFDSYRLSSHVAQYPIPIITGIGHEKDESVADLVAAMALKTPTAVATYLVGMMQELEYWLDSATQAISNSAKEYLLTESGRIREFTYQVSEIKNRAVSTFRISLDKLEWSLKSEVKALLLSEKRRLDSVLKLLESRNPRHIMAMGYAVLHRNGKLVKGVKNIGVGERVEITLYDGKLESEVVEIEPNPMKTTDYEE